MYCTCCPCIMLYCQCPSVRDVLNPPDDDEYDDLSPAQSPQMNIEMDDDGGEEAQVQAAEGSDEYRPDSPSYWESPVGKSRGQDVPSNPPPLDFRPLQWSAESMSATKTGEYDNQLYPAGSALQAARNNKKM